MRAFLLGIIATIVALFVIGLVVFKTGRIDFSADNPPSDTEKHLAMSAVDASTDRHAPEVTVLQQVNGVAQLAPHFQAQ